MAYYALLKDKKEAGEHNLKVGNQMSDFLSADR